MDPLQILIHRNGYTIYNGIQKRHIVSNIQRMDDALEMFHKLSEETTRSPEPPKHSHADWVIVPGVLIS